MPRSVWVRNLWLLAPGIFCLLASFGLGSVHFAGAVRHFFLQYIPGFPERLTAELLVIYWMTAIAGIAAVAGYLLLGVCRLEFLRWLLFPTKLRETVKISWRELLLLLVIVNSFAFTAVRFVRDGVRTVWLQGLSFGEKKEVLFSENPLEQNYIVGQEFLSGEGYSGGNIVILRNVFEDRPGEYLRAEHLHFSAHLFPVRVYLTYAPGCTTNDLPPGWMENRGIRWVVEDCGEHFQFDPKPYANRTAQ